MNLEPPNYEFEYYTTILTLHSFYLVDNENQCEYYIFIPLVAIHTQEELVRVISSVCQSSILGIFKFALHDERNISKTVKDVKYEI